LTPPFRPGRCVQVLYDLSPRERRGQQHVPNRSGEALWMAIPSAANGRRYGSRFLRSFPGFLRKRAPRYGRVGFTYDF
jgi:hypothetical protein